LISVFQLLADSRGSAENHENIQAQVWPVEKNSMATTPVSPAVATQAAAPVNQSATPRQQPEAVSAQSSKQPAAVSTASARAPVQISAAALSALKEARETPAQTAKEAQGGDVTAQRLLAKSAARAAQYKK
jgi:hypothetical protein